MLRRHYPASSLIRASPPPRTARSGPRGLSVGSHVPPPSRVPVLHRISCADMPPPIPRWNPWSLSHHGGWSPPVSRDDGLPRVATGSASTSPCFGACTAFTCVAACLLAEPPEAARCLEGFDGFVTSAAAPIATGWSDQLSGQELHLLKIRAFTRRTAIGTPGSTGSRPHIHNKAPIARVRVRMGSAGTIRGSGRAR